MFVNFNVLVSPGSPNVSVRAHEERRTQLTYVCDLFSLFILLENKRLYTHAKNKDKKIEENEKTKEKRIDRIEVYVTVEHTVTYPHIGQKNVFYPHF